jgi:hypothetical protein
MRSPIVSALIAILAALPLVAAVQPAQPGPDTEERLSEAARTLPATQRAKLHVARGLTTAQDQPVTATMHPGALNALRKQHLVPHERALADPAITLYHVRKIDAICTVLPATTRRTAGLDDAACAAAAARLAAPLR